MQPSVRNAIARIDVMQQGRCISRGTGFLVADGLVLTALHVVADRNQPSLMPYPGEIALTFPTASAKATIHEEYWDRMADWVLLRCDAVTGVCPLPLAELRDDGCAWETYGFPDANPRDGMVNIGEVSNRLGTLEGNPVYQLFSREASAGQGEPVKGLSGSPVIVQNAAVGLLRFALMKDGQTVAGTVYACPVTSVLEKAGKLLPLPDPCFGLPGLPRQPLPTEPFRHLAWFTAKEAEVFFGRNREIRQMYDRLTADDAPPVVLLYGQAGVGKSSFLDAGLMPRLRWYHQVCYLRRDPRSTLLRTLRENLDTLGGGEAQAAGSLAAAWLAAEQRGGKPLVVFLDQVEEVYTHPNPRFPNELEEFVQQIAKLFDGSVPLRGRLVLSFRKEWFPELQKQVEVNGLSYNKVFLEGLNRDAVMEAIDGPTLTGRLRQFYNLTIEPGLPGTIADDLLADRDSPIAPTLQILLTKMWGKATAQSRSAPAMTVALYQVLKKEGLLLGDFLDQQLEALRPVRAEWVESGLALDLLAYHTTPMLTARECGLDELLARYQHRAADIPPLLQEMENLFLLSDTSRDDGHKATRLCHDTLAPLVRQRYATSESPGQRARRIIESRVDDWVEGSDVGLLDEGSLQAVVLGQAGMRLLSPKEQKLIDASRAEQRKRQRNRMLLRIGAGVALAAIVAASVVAGLQAAKAADQESLAKMQLALNDSVRILPADPAIGLMLAVAAVQRAAGLKAAYSNGQLDPKVQATLDTALNASLEEGSINSAAVNVAWLPDGSLALFKPTVITADKVQVGLEFWDGSGKRLLQSVTANVNIDEVGPPLTAASTDGKVFAQAMSRIHLWNAQGKEVGLSPPSHGKLLALAFVPGAGSVVSGSGDGYVQLWDDVGALLWQAKVPGAPKVQAVAAAKTPEGKLVIVSGGSDDVVRLWHDGGSPAGTIQQHGQSIASVAVTYRADGTARILSGGSDGAVVLFDGHSNPVQKAKYDAAACQAIFNPQGTIAAIAFDDATVRILDSESGNELFPDYHVAGTGCPSIAFDSDGSRLAVSYAQVTHLLNLDRANLIGVMMAQPQKAIGKICWSPKGDRIAAAGTDGWFYLADPKTLAVRKIDNAPIGSDGSLDRPELTALAFNQDGSLLATAVTGGGDDHAIRLWDAGGKVSRELRQRSASAAERKLDVMQELAFTRDGRYLLSGSAGGTVTVWDLQGQGSRTLTLDAPGSENLNGRPASAWPIVAFSPDGNTIATYSSTRPSSSPRGVDIWGLDGRAQGKPLDVSGTVNAIQFSPDGQSLFVWSSGGMLRWHFQTGKVVTKVPETLAAGAFVRSALSPDHQTVYLAGKDIGVWSTVTGEPIATFTGHPGGTLAVDVSPDGSTLASGGADGPSGSGAPVGGSGCRLPANSLPAIPAC